METFKLIGREKEIREIIKYWHKSRDESKGGFLFLVGEAGVGKSALLKHILAHDLADHNIFQLSCECEITQQSEYFPLVKAVTHFMRSTNSAKTRMKLTSIASETFGDFIGLVPGLANAAGIVSKISNLHSSEYLPQFVNYNSKTMIMFARFFLTLSEKKPTVLAIDDLQWADHDSIALLHYLSESIDTKPLFIICTIRAEYLNNISAENPIYNLVSDLIRNQKAIRLDLTRLPLDKMSQLIRRFVGPHKFSENDVKMIFKETEGNPFFLRELLFLLFERKLIIKNKRFVIPTGDVGGTIIPPTIKEIIKERIHKLPLEFRRTLDVASVIGSEFNSDIVCSVLGANEYELLERLRDLERIYSLVERINGSHKFYHIKIQETLYEELPPNLRKLYHLGIAKYFANKSIDEFYEIAADHFKEGDNVEEALELYAMSAQCSFDRENYRSTKRTLSKLLDMVKDNKINVQPELAKNYYFMRARTNFHLGLYKESKYDLKATLNFINSNDLELKAQIYHFIGRSNYFLGLRDSCISAYNESLTIANSIDDRQLTFLNHLSLATVNDLVGDYINMENQYNEACRLAEKWEDSLAHANVLLKYGMIIMDEPPKVIPKIQKALKIYTELMNPRGIAASHLNLGNEFYFLHDLEEAEKHYLRSLQIIEEYEGVEQCYPLNNVAMVYQAQNKYEDALRVLERALSCHLTNYHRIFILNNMANTLRLMARPTEAIRILERILPDVEEDCDPVTPETSYYNLGMAYFYASRYTEAIQYIKKSFVGRRKSNEALIRGKRFKDLARCYSKLGEPTKSEFCLRKSQELLNSDVPDLWYYKDLDYETADLAFYE